MLQANSPLGLQDPESASHSVRVGSQGLCDPASRRLDPPGEAPASIHSTWRVSYCYRILRLDESGGTHRSLVSLLSLSQRVMVVYFQTRGSTAYGGSATNVPAVYLTWAILTILTIVTLCGINNLRQLNTAFGFESRPAHHDFQGFICEGFHF